MTFMAVFPFGGFMAGRISGFILFLARVFGYDDPLSSFYVDVGFDGPIGNRM